MKFLNTVMLATVLASAGSYAANVSTTLTATDDYRFRGITQSAGDAALQGSLDLAFDNGIYAGAWASNIDFGGDGSTEVDYYLGYYTDITDELGFDISVFHYTYPGLDYDGDYSELSSSLFYQDFTLQLAYSDDFGNSDKSATYVALDYERVIVEKLGFAQDISLVLHAGHSSGDYWDKDDIGSYSDYSIGVATDIKGFNVKVAYLNNNIADSMETNSGAFANDNSINLTVSTTFDLTSF
jgi:uncharacterized protein (TIGR02001 family)